VAIAAKARGEAAGEPWIGWCNGANGESGRHGLLRHDARPNEAVDEVERFLDAAAAYEIERPVDTRRDFRARIIEPALRSEACGRDCKVERHVDTCSTDARAHRSG